MRISYRQGLVAAQPGFLQINSNNGVDLIISPTPVLATIASGPVDYLIGEYHSVTNAWGPFPTNNTPHYLYWQVDQFSGAVTRGSTIISPINAASAPASPSVGQIWWDSVNNVTNIWNGSVWTPTLLVFAATVSGPLILVEPFTSQVGLNTPVDAGYILTDGFGGVFRDNNGVILTTETPLLSNDTGSLVKLDGAQFIIQASEALPAFSVVYINNGYASLASSIPPNNVTMAPMAMVATATPQNGPATLIVGGKQVFNQQWAWTPSQQGQSVYCSDLGEITLTQPPTENFVQVGIITGPQSILLTFDHVFDDAESSAIGPSIAAVSEVLGVAPITIGGTITYPVVSMPQVSSSNSGYLDAADYTTFTGYAAQIATKVDSTYSGWSIAQVVGLQSQLNTFVTASQNWPIAQVTGLSAQLATFVTAAQTWPISQVTGLQGQLNTINTQLNNKTNLVVGALGNLSMITTGGQLADSGVAAATVAGKANKVTAAIAGDFASLTSSGDIVDSGLNVASFATPADITSLQNQITATNTALGLKVDTVQAAVPGDFAVFVSGGNIADSGFTSSSFAPAAQTSSAISIINGEIITINNTLNNKVDKVPSAVIGNFSTFTAGGDVTDSGLNSGSFIATGTMLPQSQITGLTTSLNSKVNKSGDTMSGALYLPSINIGGNILVDQTGSVTAGGSGVGLLGQVLTSSGPGAPPTWVNSNISAPPGQLIFGSATGTSYTDDPSLMYDPINHVLTVGYAVRGTTLSTGNGSDLAIAGGLQTTDNSSGSVYIGTYDTTGAGVPGNVIFDTGTSASSAHGYIDFQTGNTSVLKINGDGTFYLSGSAGNAGQVLTTNGPGSAPVWTDVSGGSSGPIVPYDPNTNTITVDNIAATNGTYGQDNMALSGSSVVLDSTYFNGATSSVVGSLAMNNNDLTLSFGGANQLVISGNGSWTIGNNPYNNLTGNPGDILTSGGSSASPTWQDPIIYPAPMNLMGTNGANPFDFGSAAHHNAYFRVGSALTVTVRADSFFTGSDSYWTNNNDPQNPGPMPLGGFSDFVQTSTGVVTFVADTGVTINTAGGLTTTGAFVKVKLIKVGTNMWDLVV